MTSLHRLAREHAKRIVGNLAPDLRSALATDPYQALGDQGIEIQMRPETHGRGGCSVDGSYRRGSPPRITVAEAASRARRRFTALHEFGHHLVKLDADVHEAFATFEDGGVALEEAIADAVAAELLIPDDVVDQHIDPRGPTARAVCDLYHATLASREATCVRASQRLIGSGYIMLGEAGVALFTAAVGHPYRVARGTPQGSDSLIAKAEERGTAREQSRVVFASGKAGELLFGDAVFDDGYVFALLTDRPSWERLTVRSADDIIPSYEGTCRRCDVDFTDSYQLCQRCREPRCPRCGDCWCETAPPLATRTCSVCFLKWGLDRFRGESTVCKDCE